MEIANTSYYRAVAGSYTLSPFDLNGNIIPVITIECDSTLGIITIDLFEISVLNGRRTFRLNVIDVSGTASINQIKIRTTGSDIIDDLGTDFLSITTDGASIVMAPISDISWIAVESNSSSGGGSAFVTTTYTDLSALRTAGTLVPGTTYYMSDKGIWIQALTPTELATNGERVMRIIKNSYYTIAGTHLGVYNKNTAPSVSDTVIWGGRVWSNVNGLEGVAIDEYLLDAEWSVIATSNNTYYESKSFQIIYDFDNQWVSSQVDDRDNTISGDFSASSLFAPYNGADLTDWGNNKILNNRASGIFNNAAYVGNDPQSISNNCCTDGGVFHNESKSIIGNYVGSISNNRVAGFDIQNNNGGSIAIIQNNLNAGAIENNYCYEISGNTNAGAILSNISDRIVDNTNNGVISRNICLGITGNDNNSIYQNIIPGSIFNNTITGDIGRNTNKGNISNNLVNCTGILNNTNLGEINANNNVGEITGNSNKGFINSNTNDGAISLNSNEYFIELNTNTGAIVGNKNNGEISGNSCTGEIAYNTNNGFIANVSIAGIVSKNTNNGNIFNIFAPTTEISTNINNGDIVTSTPGVISDAIVNK